MTMYFRILACITLSALAVVQAPAAAQGGRGGRGAAAPEFWWVAKTRGGVYKPPMRPLWRKADLLKMHAGQNTWSEQIIKDPEQDATYNSGAPGTKYPRRMHSDNAALFVVLQGQVRFDVEGQEPVVATRGALVNILFRTIYSYEVIGNQNALWVEVHPNNYVTVYPAADPAPAPPKGAEIVKVSFNHAPTAYAQGQKLMINVFEDNIGKCQPGGVQNDHIRANPLIGYFNPSENPCANITRGPAAPSTTPFNPKSTFGHLHAGPAEWWIVQAGGISGKFENIGEVHAVEGDVLYAAPMMWHQMGIEGPSGPSIRLAMFGWPGVNMANTVSAGGTE